MTDPRTAEMTRRAAEAVVEITRRTGLPPTCIEVAHAIGLHSKATARVWLERAVDSGMLCSGPERASRRYYAKPNTEGSA